MAKIVSQRNLFFVVEISVIRRKISLQNCGTEMRHRNAARNFSTKLQRKIVVQNCDAELCENEFLKDISIYIKVGDPRTKTINDSWNTHSIKKKLCRFLRFMINYLIKLPKVLDKISRPNNKKKCKYKITIIFQMKQWYCTKYLY